MRVNRILACVLLVIVVGFNLPQAEADAVDKIYVRGKDNNGDGWVDLRTIDEIWVEWSLGADHGKYKKHIQLYADGRLVWSTTICAYCMGTGFYTHWYFGNHNEFHVWFLEKDNCYSRVEFTLPHKGNFRTYGDVVCPSISGTLDLDPDTLNLKSKGKWITAYIELEEGYDVRDINASTILLNDVLAPELNPKYGFVKSETSYIMDHDGDGVLERMVKFNRSEVQQLLSPGDSMPLKITGKLYDDTEFEGNDEIKVIDPINSVQSIDEQIPRQGVGLDQRQPSKRSASLIEFQLRVRESPPLASLI